MDWKPLLIYSMGVVDQELLLRHEYLSTGNRFLRQQIVGHPALQPAPRSVGGALCL
jgi:hypothetical protein